MKSRTNFTMICVECKYEVPCTYYKYKGDYIKLAVCPHCHQIVDQYVEYDNVLLFLDLVLVKPQAYRHVCYNVMENQMAIEGVKKGQTSTVTMTQKFQMFGNLARFIVMMILFEVYLSWAYEEKKPTHSIIYQFILSRDTYIQYISFVFKSIINHVVFNVTLQWVFFNFLGWKNLINQNLNHEYQTSYYRASLLSCVLVANSIKLLPILMLIWPYDQTVQWQKIVGGLAVVNIIEALKNITNLSYFKIILTVSLCILVEQVISIGIASLTISYYTNYDVYDIFINNYQEIISDISFYINL
ncbi:protein Arv1p [[Candida] jaroonii]|uniref:Protein Arv1p n=1 Tax=[Candida] jaroonii TaxID=467808 RepID=A0ACA9Y2K7_9ASCO|nr:protein Arv1p [[Candida] jaroonii]